MLLTLDYQLSLSGGNTLTAYVNEAMLIAPTGHHSDNRGQSGIAAIPTALHHKKMLPVGAQL